jgi:hypothetical protein
MGDYKKQGGALSGRGEWYDGFEGEPRDIGGSLSGKDHHSHHDSHHSNYAEDIDTGKAGGASNVDGADNTGSHSFSMANKADSRVDSDMEGSKNMGRNTNTEGGNTSQSPR